MTPMSRSRTQPPIDLHPLVDPVSASIEFRVVHKGRFVRVHLLKETMVECFGMEDTPYGLLKTYEKHRAEIDAAVMRVAQASKNDAVVLSCDDLIAH
jgi:hypothetical protein